MYFRRVSRSLASRDRQVQRGESQRKRAVRSGDANKSRAEKDGSEGWLGMMVGRSDDGGEVSKVSRENACCKEG